MYVYLSTHCFTSDCCPLILVKQFEIDDDPKADLDESSGAIYGHEEIQTPQTGVLVAGCSFGCPDTDSCLVDSGPVCRSQGNEFLHMNYSLTGEFSLSFPPHMVFIHAHSTNHGRILELGT